MTLSRLNNEGVKLFADYLASLREQPALPPPFQILSHPDFAQVLAPGVQVLQHVYATRLEIAEYVDELIAAASLSDVEQDIGLWAWLTLHFFDSLCPPTTGGERKAREQSAYIPEPKNFQRYYRHLLLGSYLIFRAHRDDPLRALSLLSKPPHIIDDIVAQLASRQEFVTNRTIVELATRLYIDPISRSTKRGSGGKGAGSPRRLVQILAQFDVTWDLYGMTLEEFVAVLPREFEKFIGPMSVAPSSPEMPGI